MTTRSQTAQTRRPNVKRPPGLIGENSPSQSYPTDDRGTNDKTEKQTQQKNVQKIQKTQKKYMTISHAVILQVLER
jgi:hypothetical protein